MIVRPPCLSVPTHLVRSLRLTPVRIYRTPMEAPWVCCKKYMVSRRFEPIFPSNWLSQVSTRVVRFSPLAREVGVDPCSPTQSWRPMENKWRLDGAGHCWWLKIGDTRELYHLHSWRVSQSTELQTTAFSNYQLETQQWYISGERLESALQPQKFLARKKHCRAGCNCLTWKMSTMRFLLVCLFNW